MMKRLSPRDLIAVSVTLAVLCIPLVFAGIYLAKKHNWAQEQLDSLTPRYARLLGLEASSADLGKIEAEADKLIKQYVYPATQDVAQAGNDAQQRIRTIFTGAGLELVSSQVLPPKTEKFYDRIALTVRLEGGLPALQSALVVLAEKKPTIIVEGFTVQTIGAVKAETAQRLGIQFNFSVLRGRP